MRLFTLDSLTFSALLVSQWLRIFSQIRCRQSILFCDFSGSQDDLPLALSELEESQMESLLLD